MTQAIKQSGNVIEADFPKRPQPDVKINFKIDILYADAYTALVRATFTMNGEVIGMTHAMHEVKT